MTQDDPKKDQSDDHQSRKRPSGATTRLHDPILTLRADRVDCDTACDGPGRCWTGAVDPGTTAHGSDTGTGSALGSRTVAPSPMSPKTPNAIMAMP